MFLVQGLKQGLERNSSFTHMCTLQFKLNEYSTIHPACILQEQHTPAEIHNSYCIFRQACTPNTSSYVHTARVAYSCRNTQQFMLNIHTCMHTLQFILHTYSKSSILLRKYTIHPACMYTQQFILDVYSKSSILLHTYSTIHPPCILHFYFSIIHSAYTSNMHTPQFILTAQSTS